MLIGCCYFSFYEAKAASYQVGVTSETPKLERRKNLLEDILMSYSKIVKYRSLIVLIDEKQREPRGKILGEKITLSAQVLKDGEFVKLFVHELAHYIDIYFLTGFGVQIDPSREFYAISWTKPQVKKPSEGIDSFVSGYALSNQYEDFSESLTFYIFHNEEFASRALSNPSLRAKYLFIRNYIFTSGEFEGTDYALTKIPNYVFDTTKIPILLQKYLYSLK